MSSRGLSFLAGVSAIFIECNADGIELHEDLNMVSYLSEEMDYIFKNPSIENSAMLLEFIWPNQRDWKGRIGEDLYLHTHLFAKDLRYFKELPIDRQRELSDACLRLSEVASMRGIYDLGL